MSQSSGNFIHFRFNRTEIINCRKEKYLCYKIPEKTTPKRPALLRSSAAYVYLTKNGICLIV